MGAQMALVLNRESGQRDQLVMFGGFSVDCVDTLQPSLYHIQRACGRRSQLHQADTRASMKQRWWIISTPCSFSAATVNVWCLL